MCRAAGPTLGPVRCVLVGGAFLRFVACVAPLCAGRRPGSVVLTGLLQVAQLWLSISNFARNSPAISSNFEFMSLELQRFRVVSKNDRGKLRAKFVWARHAALRGVRLSM